jgi:hypothetical protein
MTQARWTGSALVRCAVVASLVLATGSALAGEGVKLTKEDGKVRVEIDGKLFTEYHFIGARRPYLYPVIGPTSAGMTRNWPLNDSVPGEEKDHPHHKGLWFGHRHVNGAGFWEDTGKPGTLLGQIVHDKFVEVRSGQNEGVIHAQNNWVIDGTGESLGTDDTVITIYNRTNDRIIDFDLTIHAGPKGMVFGDDKDGAMAIRVSETMRVEKLKEKGQKKAKPGDGHIVTSEGKHDGAAWGTRADWCDYFGPVAGKTVGVAMFDHPANPRHPTWWHVRTYGLFAANPFGQAQFENLPDKKAGEFKVDAGQSVTWRYRYYFHEGDEKQSKVAERYREYVAQTSGPKSKSK